MRIEFDPTNPDEAAAVRAMLNTSGMDALPEDGGGRRYAPLVRAVEEVGEWRSWSNKPTDATEPSEPSQDPELDSTGTPWDARIHSTPPTTNKDGTWRAKRGVKADEIAAVKAEREALEANLTATDAELIEQAEPLEITPAQEQSAPPALNAPAQAPTPPSAPPAPIVQPEPVVGVAPSFLDVMKAITAAQKDGKIDTAKVKELCAAVGAGESTMGLNGPDNGDKRGAFMALLGEVVS